MRIFGEHPLNQCKKIQSYKIKLFFLGLRIYQKFSHELKSDNIVVKWCGLFYQDKLGFQNHRMNEHQIRNMIALRGNIDEPEIKQHINLCLDNLVTPSLAHEKLSFWEEFVGGNLNEKIKKYEGVI